jgi:hypothetical protein
MSGILRRTVFYDDSDGYVRPFDFNLVMTAVGACMEPNFAILPRTCFCQGKAADTLGKQEYDPTDEINRVDEIKPFSLDKQMLICGEQVHGGTLLPKTGR